jgi:hypothetical protein
MKRDKMIAK